MANTIKHEFERITGISVTATYMPKGETHNPTSLQTGTCGVYAFVTDSHCLKVGKAGKRSKARWNSHHYNLDKTTPSTLPKSILKNKSSIKQLFSNEFHAGIDGLNKASMQNWIKANTSRMEFLIEDGGDRYALNLLEALAQYHLKPIFEGRPDN